MTKRILSVIAIAAGLTLGQGAVTPQPAQCTWCPTYKCFGPCGGDCKCVSTDHRGGQCVSIELIPDGAVLLE